VLISDAQLQRAIEALIKHGDILHNYVSSETMSLARENYGRELDAIVRDMSTNIVGYLGRITHTISNALPSALANHRNLPRPPHRKNMRRGECNALVKRTLDSALNRARARYGATFDRAHNRLVHAVHDLIGRDPPEAMPPPHMYLIQDVHTALGGFLCPDGANGLPPPIPGAREFLYSVMPADIRARVYTMGDSINHLKNVTVRIARATYSTAYTSCSRVFNVVASEVRTLIISCVPPAAEQPTNDHSQVECAPMPCCQFEVDAPIIRDTTLASYVGGAGPFEGPAKSLNTVHITALLGGYQSVDITCGAIGSGKVTGTICNGEDLCVKGENPTMTVGRLL